MNLLQLSPAPYPINLSETYFYNAATFYCFRGASEQAGVVENYGATEETTNAEEKPKQYTEPCITGRLHIANAGILY